MEPAYQQTPQKSISLFKLARTVVIIALVFMLGWGVGSGRMVFFKKHLPPVAQKTDNNLDYSSVENVYDQLRQDYDGQLDGEKLLDGLKQGLASATSDPYTVFLNAKAYSEFDNQLNGTFEGIGAELGKDAQGNIIVIAPISGFPAEKAGLKAKDIIIEVDDKPVSGSSIEEVINRIHGKSGTTVKLKVVRNQAKEVVISIVREKITIPSVTSKILANNIGYLKISRFAEDTTDLAQTAAKDFKAKQVKGVILDLRNDPGGLLPAAVSVSSLWLHANQTILLEKRGGHVMKTYRSDGTATLTGIPTIVLINEGSASASEITAGALHDNKAATLIGVKSFGKGSVQQLDKFLDGSVLKVTIARWYTPSDINIDKQGINPDKEVKIADDDIKAGRDPQLDAATAALK